ncbi:hypothetical protein Glove_55g33 [Diversispora epigaea]|uniref:Uncharacterized protein n=1 Tax=Diversispora epigaea TaxID=1348612 RepID=A0A397JLK5_9GLOM|nr:hypothetical protein Glove_55g33 [Diversispora epigaea]
MIEEQELGGLREYLQEFEIEQEENNEESIVENNIMDILALRSKKFKGDGTQDPMIQQMNGTTKYILKPMETEMTNGQLGQ